MNSWTSLKTQFAQRKQLSFKQVSALKRLAVSYAAQIPDLCGRHAEIRPAGAPRPEEERGDSAAARNRSVPSMGIRKPQARKRKATRLHARVPPPPEPRPGGGRLRCDDPAVAQFVRHLRAERNASEHTLAGYLSDIRQFCVQVWGDDAAPPFPWKSPDRFVARRFPGLVPEGGAGAGDGQPQDVEPAVVLPLPGARGAGEGQSVCRPAAAQGAPSPAEGAQPGRGAAPARSAGAPSRVGAGEGGEGRRPVSRTMPPCATRPSWRCSTAPACASPNCAD